ncbi:glutamate racemase [Paenibacillus thermotolerans]|uniref:glutamate racemase n=1 Tax=Paenibacillus thermotolerans TaxID=3027807 RepID=UPI002367AD2C|nr:MULTISPECIES: glutamate racemase [unclassified Paenibacillus]
MSNQQAIAVLDSGVGGLTVAKEIMRQLPQEQIIYFGDTARAPYGPRPAHEVERFTEEIVRYLQHFDPKMIVIACNTATAVALDTIRSAVDVPVLGVITPGARAALKVTRSGEIGVIGTEGTIRSGAYEAALRRIAPGVRVVSQACPAFAPMVESGEYRTGGARDTVCNSLKGIKDESIDTLILGCTHYPFLTDLIQECMGPGVTLISSADQTARDVSTLLYHNGLLASSEKTPVHHFFCSGDEEMFKAIAEEWLGDMIRTSPVIWQMPSFL